MLFGDELIDALEAMIEAHPAGEDAPLLGYIDGALAGLLVLPKPVPLEDWLPVLGAGPDVGFADPADSERFADLLRWRQAEVAAQLLHGDLAYAPLFEIDEAGYPLWQIWLLGFMGAVNLQQKSWDRFLKSRNADLAAAATGLMALAITLRDLAEEFPRHPLPDGIDDMAEAAPEMIPYFVETVYRCQRGLPRIVLTDGWEDGAMVQQPIRVVKVGRNEPCPCGSGKKYKKCCGA